LENYQACSKIATLEGNIRTAFIYQLKILRKLNLQSTGNYSMPEISRETTMLATKIISQNAHVMADSAYKESSQNIKRNTELFNRQAEKNFMESLENSVTRNWMKIPTSRSLNNLQTIAQELYTFDCQGGSEELCKTRKNDSLSNIDVGYSDIESNTNEDEEWIDDLFNKNGSLLRNKNITCISSKNLTDSMSVKTMFNIDNNDNQTNKCDIDKGKRIPFSDIASSRSQRNYVINETIRALKFYLNNIANEANILKCEILQDAINFWVEHNLPMQSLENVFLDHIHVIYYPLGLLLFW